MGIENETINHFAGLVVLHSIITAIAFIFILILILIKHKQKTKLEKSKSDKKKGDKK